MGVHDTDPLTTCFIGATCGHVDDMGFVPVAPQAVHMVVPTRFTAFNPSLLRVLDATDDVGDLVERGFVLAHEALGLVHGMDDGGVIATTE